MTRPQNLLIPLDDLAYLLECAAMDCRGELKGELHILISAIEDRRPGYKADSLQGSLPDLRAALDQYRAGKGNAGACLLSRVSRALWGEARKPHSLTFRAQGLHSAMTGFLASIAPRFRGGIR